MRYKMKVDAWIRVLLYAIMFMFIPIMFFVPPEEIWIMILTTLIMALIIVPLFYGYYELRDDYLFIRMSVFTQKIQYDKIKSLRICSNWLSSSSMTKERIEIKEHDKGFVRGTTYIGPEDREELLYELEKRCFNLEKQDE